MSGSVRVPTRWPIKNKRIAAELFQHFHSRRTDVEACEHFPINKSSPRPNWNHLKMKRAVKCAQTKHTHTHAHVFFFFGWFVCDETGCGHRIDRHFIENAKCRWISCRDENRHFKCETLSNARHTHTYASKRPNGRRLSFRHTALPFAYKPPPRPTHSTQTERFERLSGRTSNGVWEMAEHYIVVKAPSYIEVEDLCKCHKCQNKLSNRLIHLQFKENLWINIYSLS